MGKEGKRMAQNPQTLKRKKAFKDAGLEEWRWLFPARKDTNSRRKANNICYNNYNEGCKNIRFCKSCKQCWEKAKVAGGSGNRRIEYMWYEDFPSYKRKREKCPRCKDPNFSEHR